MVVLRNSRVKNTFSRRDAVLIFVIGACFSVVALTYVTNLKFFAATSPSDLFLRHPVTQKTQTEAKQVEADFQHRVELTKTPTLAEYDDDHHRGLEEGQLEVFGKSGIIVVRHAECRDQVSGKSAHITRCFRLPLMPDSPLPAVTAAESPGFDRFYVRLSPEQWDKQLELIGAVNRAFELMNCTYFGYFGTLLGAIRHGMSIPWDDDFDAAVPLAEVLPVMGMLDEPNWRNDRRVAAHPRYHKFGFHSLGRRWWEDRRKSLTAEQLAEVAKLQGLLNIYIVADITRFISCGKIYFRDGGWATAMFNLLPFTWPFFDLFCAFLDPDAGTLKFMHRAVVLNMSDVYPLRRVPFGFQRAVLPVPRRPEKCLELLWPEALDRCESNTWDHFTEGFIPERSNVNCSGLADKVPFTTSVKVAYVPAEVPIPSWLAASLDESRQKNLGTAATKVYDRQSEFDRLAEREFGLRLTISDVRLFHNNNNNNQKLSSGRRTKDPLPPFPERNVLGDALRAAQAASLEVQAAAAAWHPVDTAALRAIEHTNYTVNGRDMGLSQSEVRSIWKLISSITSSPPSSSLFSNQTSLSSLASSTNNLSSYSSYPADRIEVRISETIAGGRKLFTTYAFTIESFVLQSDGV